jgi:hypothetical protein
MSEGYRNPFGSDKIYWHRYLDTYESLFQNLPPAPSILEYGTFQGDSVRFLLERFPESNIVSADIISESVEWPVSSRVLYTQLDQGDQLLVASRLQEIGRKYDLIIEDGSHVPSHQRNSLVASIDYLKDGGFYVVEDLHTSSEQLRFFGIIAPANIGVLEGNDRNTNYWLTLHNALMQFLNKFAKTVPKVNLLTFLLALERQIALNSRLSDVEIASLIRDGFFSMEEITKLSEKVKSIHFYRRLGLPLFCHACESKTFDLTTLRCVCGTRLYKDDDSFMAVLRVVH